MNPSEQDAPPPPIVIPRQRLSDEAVRGLIEEYVTRDGTELSEADAKAQRVRHGLASGALVIVFDSQTGTCNIAHREDLPAELNEEQSDSDSAR